MSGAPAGDGVVHEELVPVTLSNDIVVMIVLMAGPLAYWRSHRVCRKWKRLLESSVVVSAQKENWRARLEARFKHMPFDPSPRLYELSQEMYYHHLLNKGRACVPLAAAVRWRFCGVFLDHEITEFMSGDINSITYFTTKGWLEVDDSSVIATSDDNYDLNSSAVMVLLHPSVIGSVWKQEMGALFY